MQPSCCLAQQTKEHGGIVLGQKESEEAQSKNSMEVESKVAVKEDLKVINLSHDTNIDKPISISTSLSAIEIASLVFC